jgi:hypothetical protein
MMSMTFGLQLLTDDRGFLRYHWACRAGLSLESFDLHFLVVADTRIVGLQSRHRRPDDPSNVVETGSWLGLAHQGHGLGMQPVMRRSAVAPPFVEA